MSRVAGPDLVAEVLRAGGLGILAGQSAGLIADSPSAGDIVRSLAEEAATVRRSLAARA